MNVAMAALVSVLYAGSLVTPMQGPIAKALATRGIAFQGQPGGSKQLANLIAAGLRTPDIFISVDPALVAKLGEKVASSVTFADTAIGLGWKPNSKGAAEFAAAAAGRVPWLSALTQPGILLGRTDPRLDPKGAYTIDALRLLLGTAGERRVLGADENPMQIFPEEDLLARLDTGEIDAGIFYRTEAIARHLQFAPFPGAAGLPGKITFTLAVLKDAPHPRAARAFESFLLHGAGRAILQAAGLHYLGG